jgi:hypothetical protein
MGVAKSEGADLIVAGAYGHSRLGEWVFGRCHAWLAEEIRYMLLFGQLIVTPL